MSLMRFNEIIFVLIGLLLAGCGGDSVSDESQRLARVGSEVLTLEEARENIPAFIYQQDSVNAIRQYREDWIRQQLMLQEAYRLQIRQNKETLKRLQRLQNEVLTEALKDEVLARFEETLNVTDEEVQNYYQANKEQFILDEKFVRFRHLEADDVESARAAKRELLRGIPWEEVAQKYSVEPDLALRNSEQFWPVSLAMRDMEILNRYLNVIGQMEISPIRRIGSNYHFVQLIETRAKGEHPDLEWLMSQIKDWLRMEKRRRYYNSYVKNLYLKAESNNEIESYNVLESSEPELTENPDSAEIDKND